MQRFWCCVFVSSIWFPSRPTVNAFVGWRKLSRSLQAQSFRTLGSVTPCVEYKSSAVTDKSAELQSFRTLGWIHLIESAIAFFIIAVCSHFVFDQHSPCLLDDSGYEWMFIVLNLLPDRAFFYGNGRSRKTVNFSSIEKPRSFVHIF